MEYRPQFAGIRAAVIAWALLSVATLVFVSFIPAAPLAAANNHPQLALAIYQPFHFLCHQLPERSFYLAGYKLAVCARCTGIYSGFLLLLLLYPLVRSLRETSLPHRRWLLLATTPLVIDFGLTFLGIWENTHTSRFLTGFLFGAVTVFYIMPGILELSFQLNRTKSTKRQEFTVLSGESIAAAPSDYSAPARRI
ncbi:MAG TPA: DUF2085 domain-containing protein [Pyrinomonadaceae bacterium]|nr:DUF2085 domain-containing protein [Pyrinomonadaceae bacterium]